MDSGTTIASLIIEEISFHLKDMINYRNTLQDPIISMEDRGVFDLKLTTKIERIRQLREQLEHQTR